MACVIQLKPLGDGANEVLVGFPVSHNKPLPIPDLSVASTIPAAAHCPTISRAIDLGKEALEIDPREHGPILHGVTNKRDRRRRAPSNRSPRTLWVPLRGSNWGVEPVRRIRAQP